MQELLDHIAARFPEVAMGCREFAARWLADEAALLEPNHVLVRSRDDILPGLARAIRARDVELSEVARRCGLEARDLRVTVALSRLGELLNPGDIANLSDQELLEAPTSRSRVRPPRRRTFAGDRQSLIRDPAKLTPWDQHWKPCHRPSPTMLGMQQIAAAVLQDRLQPECLGKTGGRAPWTGVRMRPMPAWISRLPRSATDHAA